MIAGGGEQLAMRAMRNFVCGVIATFLPVSAKPKPAAQISS
jgi:hypothetical protein